MMGITESISNLKYELHKHKRHKKEILNELEKVRSDFELPDISDDEKEDLETKVSSLEEELESTNEVIATIEEDLRHLIGSPSDQSHISNVAQRAESILDRVEDEYEELQNTHELLDKKSKRLDEKQSQVEDLEETAKGLLERSTGYALGEQFAERKSELEDNLVYWKIASVCSIGLLLVSAAGIYIDIVFSDTDAVANISKIALVLPISVAVWFTVSNYSRQKKLMEEYEFKARMALSLTGFSEVLRQETTAENEELIAEFNLETMDKIYSNPQKNIHLNTRDDQDDPLTTGQKPLVDLIKRLSD